MEVQNGLAMSLGQMRRDYDEACKRMLAEPQVRARILQAYVPEFTGMGAREIEALLGDDVEVGTEPVGRDGHAAWSACGERNTEDSTISEGTARFDVRFTAPIPGGGRAVVEVDLEAQNAWSPGYPLASRAAFYCARMLSAQGARVLPQSRFGELDKVYSIWICSHPGRRHRGREDAFAVRPLGDGGGMYEGYDLMEFRFVCLDAGLADAAHGCLGLLSALFVGEADAGELRRSLADDFGIIVTEEIDERVGRMCNFSEGVWEDGRAAGIKQGRQQGIEQGRAQCVLALMRGMSLTLGEAMDRLGVPGAERDRCERLVAAMS